MDREEALKRTDHYRCRRCGQLSPITETLCTKPGCRAQLGIYGEMVVGEDGASQEPEIRNSEETAKKKYTTPKKKPVKEKKQSRKQRYIEEPVTYPYVQTDKSFLQKKTLLIWLSMVFLLVYGLLAFCCEQVSRRPSTDEVLMCIAIMLAVTIPAIVLARKEKYILHSLVCLLAGAVSFVAAGAVLSPPGDTVYMFLAMVAAYWWLGILSFLGTSRKRKSEDGTAAFLKKKTILIFLDIVILFAICGVLRCFRAGLYYLLYNGTFRLYLDDCIVPGIVAMAVTVLNIVLAHKEKYVLRGVLLCVIGAAIAFWGLAYSRYELYLLIDTTVGVLYIWLGIISFLKEE